MNTEMKDSRIVFIGAGNLATHLARALYAKGYNIVQVYSRTLEAASELASKVAASFTNDFEAINTDASLYIISLRDSAFVNLIPQIVKGKNKEALFVHTAGTLPMELWQGHASRYGVFYPMQTFSKQRDVDFASIPIFIEANNQQDTDLLLKIASDISQKARLATSEQRKKLHVAAVFACNFTNHMYALTAELLEKSNLSFDVMLPLIDETARKVHTLAPHTAQTGPAKRNDLLVMNEHLRMLEDDPAVADLYATLSQSITNHHKND